MLSTCLALLHLAHCLVLDGADRDPNDRYSGPVHVPQQDQMDPASNGDRTVLVRVHDRPGVYRSGTTH